MNEEIFQRQGRRLCGAPSGLYLAAYIQYLYEEIGLPAASVLAGAVRPIPQKRTADSAEFDV